MKTPTAEGEDKTSVTPKRPGPSRFVPTGSLLQKSRESGVADEILSTDKISAKLGKPVTVPATKVNGSSPISGSTIQMRIIDFSTPKPLKNGNVVINGLNRISTNNVTTIKRTRSSSAISVENDSVEISLEGVALNGSTSASNQTRTSSQDEEVTPRRLPARKRSSPELPISESRVGSARPNTLTDVGSRDSPELPISPHSAAQNTYRRWTRRSLPTVSYMEVDLGESSRTSSSLDSDDVDYSDDEDFSLYLEDDDKREETSTSKVEVEEAENLEDSLSTNERSSSVIGNLVDPFNAKPGDLMWARVGQPLYWPCAITQDPNLPFHTKTTKKGKAFCLEYHVQFFGRPSRAWVTKANLMPYLGVDEYNLRIKNAKSKTSVTTRKKLLKELIPITQKQQWGEAFNEMTMVESMEVNERISYLYEKLFESNPIDRKKRKSFNSMYAAPKPTVTDQALEPEDQFEKHRLIVSKIPQEAINENYQLLTSSGYKLFKFAMLLDCNKSFGRANGEKAEKKLLHSWNLLSLSEKQFYVDTAKELPFDSEVDVSVNGSVVSQSDSLRSTQKFYKSEVFKAEKMAYSTKNQFKKESFCILCEKVSKEEGDLLKCNGVCHNSFHKTCLKSEVTIIDAQIWKCEDCLTNQHSCFICKSKDGNRERCSISSCGKFYHRDCLRSSLWPQSRLSETQITCPYHMCHTCASDDPQNPHMKYNSKLLKCTRCPTSYHSGDYCVAAGTYQITASDIICPKHFVPPKEKKAGTHHVSISWCLICSSGGNLICCELCPSCFHQECLNLDTVPDLFYCTSCETGRLPLYGEILWTKLGNYRWWPAQVMFPDQLPLNVLKMSHDVGQFAVQFCGTKEFCWMDNGRCYPYHEGDSEKTPRGSSACSPSLQASYLIGVQEAAVLFKEHMEKRSKSEELNESKVRAQPHLRPPLYVKIKSNRPFGDYVLKKSNNQKSNQPCKCTPTSKDPCGPTSDCHNRSLYMECRPDDCPTKELCGNRMFQKKKYPPMSVKHTKTKGWGLFIKADVKKGDFIIEYVGELITGVEFKKRIDEKLNNKDADQNYYFMDIDNNSYIDAGLKGNYARFINHSCDPNCETMKWTVNGQTRIGIFARKDIPANAELTFDYQLEEFGEAKKPCLCEAENCCGYLGKKAKQVTGSNGVQAQVAVAKKGTKKKKKKKAKIDEHEHENWCFRCYNFRHPSELEVQEELIPCDYKDCRRAYHLRCIGKDPVPHGQWHCPWHFCLTCGKPSTTRCDHCPIGYCSDHSKLMGGRSGIKNLCNEHERDYADISRFYQTLASECKRDRRRQLAESQGEPKPKPKRARLSSPQDKRGRFSRASPPPPQEPYENVTCDVYFCGWVGSREALIEHEEAVHTPRTPEVEAERPVRRKVPTVQCRVDGCTMKMRTSLLRRHCKARHPEYFRELYGDEAVPLMETPSTPQNQPEGSDLPPEASPVHSTQTGQPSTSSRQASRSSFNGLLRRTCPRKGYTYICDYGNCKYVSKVSTNMMRHRRVYNHFLDESHDSPQENGSLVGGDGQPLENGNHEDREVPAIEIGREEPTLPIKVKDAAVDELVHNQLREEPQEPVEPEDAILAEDAAAA